MRSLIAAAMLLLQLQPVLGLALCSAMAGNDRQRMEVGCPMPESVPAAVDPHARGWSVPTPSRDCVFAEACAPSPIVANSVRASIISLAPQIESPVRFPSVILPIVSHSPPVPPPKP